MTVSSLGRFVRDGRIMYLLTSVDFSRFIIHVVRWKIQDARVVPLGYKIKPFIVPVCVMFYFKQAVRYRTRCTYRLKFVPSH